MPHINAANSAIKKIMTGTKRTSTDAEKQNEECSTPDTDTRSDKRAKTSHGLSGSTAPEDVRPEGNRKAKEFSVPLKYTTSMCESPKVSRARDHEVTSASAEKQLEAPEKPAKTVVDRVSFDSAKTIDPSEPPQKPIDKTNDKHSFMITFNKWRRGIYTREAKLCDECHYRVSEALKTSNLHRVCKSEDDAVKIEAGEAIVKKITQNCYNGVCKDSKSSENRRAGRPHRTKAGSGLDEGSLELQVTDRVMNLAAPFGNTGKQFLASIETGHKAQLATQAEIEMPMKTKLPDTRLKTRENKPAHSPLTRRSELIGNDNPKLSTFSDEGRLERVKAVENEIGQFARTVKKSSIPKDQPEVIRLISLRIEGLAYKHSTSVLAYLQRFERTIELLHSQKIILEWKVQNGMPRPGYNKDFLKMLKGEPSVIELD